MSDQPDQPDAPIEPLAETDPVYWPLQFPRPGTGVANTLFTLIGNPEQTNDYVQVDLDFYQPGTPFYRRQKSNFSQYPFQVRLEELLPVGLTYVHYVLLGRNNDWSRWHYSGRFYVMAEMTIDAPAGGNVSESRPLFSGMGQVGATFKLYRVYLNSFIDISDIQHVPVGGRWSVRPNQDLLPGSTTIFAEQTVTTNLVGEPTFTAYKLSSARKTVVYTQPTLITLPKPNQIVRADQIVFEGIGQSNSAIGVVNAADHYQSISETVTVGSNASWRAPVRSPLVLPSGDLTVQAKHSVGYSAPLTFRVLGAPTLITAAGEQDTTFNLSGANGLAGSVVTLYIDRSDTKVGQTGVLNNLSWTGTVTLSPGPVSLVAEQSQAGVISERSAVRLYKIRPPILTSPTMAVLPDNKVKISGSGFTGATVEFTYVSGPGAQTLPPVSVAGGAWEVTATSWPPGSYTFSVTQKVSDGAGGWIISQPRQFAFTWAVASPSDVTYTVTDYTPTFSGRGTTGATVRVRKSGGAIAAPDARVVNNQWSSQSGEPWGPTFEQVVHLKQILNGQQSEGWVEIKVTIAPLAPVITSLVENGLSPTVTGTCWPGAVVSLVFSDRPTVVHSPSGATGTWTFRRPTDFASGVTHTVTVTQTAASQTSPPVQRTFTVAKTLLKPVITEPQENAEAGRELTVRGSSGVAGASMQLRDAQFGRPLGSPKVLTRDGDWEISLTGLEFRLYQIDAQQRLDGRDSERSLERNFYVVVLPPQILVPVSGGDLPRVGTVSGTGMPGALVEVFLQGRPQPLLGPLLVGVDGSWDGVVTLDVGHETLFARQTFEDKTSRDSPFQTFRVVPAAPSIETPALNEFVGRHAVVSGFGYPGDSVTVALAQAPQQVLGRGTVLDDRTWSVTVELDAPSGQRELIVVQWQGEFDSGCSSRAVNLGTYLPVIDRPAPGQRVANPIELAGTGKPGVMSVVSWFNPDTRWLAGVRVPAAQWEGTASQSLPGGGSWVRLQQTISESTPATTSDWTESERFEVLAAQPPLP